MVIVPRRVQRREKSYCVNKRKNATLDSIHDPDFVILVFPSNHGCISVCLIITFSQIEIKCSNCAQLSAIKNKKPTKKKNWPCKNSGGKGNAAKMRNSTGSPNSRPGESLGEEECGQLHQDSAQTHTVRELLKLRLNPSNI